MICAEEWEGSKLDPVYAHIPQANQYFQVHWKCPLVGGDHEAFIATINAVEDAMEKLFATSPHRQSFIWPDLKSRVTDMVTYHMTIRGCEAEFEVRKVFPILREHLK